MGGVLPDLKAMMASVLGIDYKIVLLGEVDVGKTTFFLRIRDGVFVNITGFTTSGECTSSVQIADGQVKVGLPSEHAVVYLGYSVVPLGSGTRDYH